MARPATSRLKLNPPLGRMPVLQFCAPGELRVDPAYQRSIEGSDSQALIRRIAQHWNWDLCQPLVVARRKDLTERLFVIDGQHRLEAARLRGDIAQLPCVVVDFASTADEAASFVHLNQQRRPLTTLDLFKAALASEDCEAVAIAAALADAGLSLAPHMTSAAWKPGQLGNIGGIQQAWRRHGAVVAGEALHVLSAAFAGKVLRYAGTLFPGIVAVCAEECAGAASMRSTAEGRTSGAVGRQEAEAMAPGRFAAFTAKLGARGQDRLRRDVMVLGAARPDLNRRVACIKVITELHWPERAKDAAAIAAGSRPGIMPAGTADPRPALSFVPDGAGKAWCEQCEMRVTREQAEGCRSRWCSLRAREAA